MPRVRVLYGGVGMDADDAAAMWQTEAKKLAARNGVEATFRKAAWQLRLQMSRNGQEVCLVCGWSVAGAGGVTQSFRCCFKKH